MSIDPGAPLRIVAFVEAYLQPDQTFIYRQMAQLARCDVTFVARYLLPDNPFPLDRVLSFGSKPAHRAGRVGWWLRRARQLLSGRYAILPQAEEATLESLLRRLKPSIVHSHWAPDAMLAVPVCEQLRVPLLVHFHGYDASSLTSDRFYRRSLLRLMSAGPLGLTVSEEMRQRLVALGCEPANIISHHTGVPEEYFRRSPRAAVGSRFALVQVGRLAEGKGHVDALDAFARAVRRVSHLTMRIIGGGPLLPRLRERVAALGLSNSVSLAGHLPPEQVIAELDKVDALLAPSRETDEGRIEGIPNVVVEALAARIPVIATLHGGIPEAVRYSESGWLVQEGDVLGLADRIERLAQLPSLWTRLSEEGAAIAARDFHLPTQNARLLRIYAGLLEGGIEGARRAAA